MKLVYHKIFAFLFIFLPVVFFFLRLFYPQNQLFMIPDFGESDVLHLNFPLKYILSTSLKSGQWPLWSPYLANGFPILAEGQIGTFYLPNLLLFRFLPLVWAYNLNLVLSYILASTGTYLFTRKLGFSRISSFFAGFIFTFSGFLSVHLNHFNLVQAVSLLPFIFWSGLLLWQKPKFKYAILFAFLLSQQIFTGHFYIVFITLIGVFTLLLEMIFFHWQKYTRKILIRKILYIFCAFGFSFLLAAIQLIPTIELWQLSQRSTGLDFNTVTDYPYPVKHLLTFIFPYFFGSPANGTYPPFSPEWGIFWENTAYIGIIPLILAGISIFFLKDKLVKIFWGSLLLSLLLVLGKNSPLYFIFSFPLFNLFRVPSKFLLLVTFSLAILSAYMLNRIFKIIRKSKILSLFCGALFFFLIAVDEYRFSYNYPPTTPTNLWLSAPEIVKTLKTNDRVTSSTAPFAWNKVFKKTGWRDFTPFIYFKNSLYPNYNTFFSIGQADINTGGLIPRRVSFFTSLMKDISVDEDKKEASIKSTIANALNIAGVKYFITSYRINYPPFELITVIAPPKGLQLDPILLYKNSDSLPRSYLAGNIRKIETVEDFSDNLADENFTNKQTVLIEDDGLKLETGAKSIKPVNIISEKPTETVLEADSDTASVLILADTNYPGWKAYIDGQPTEIHNVNLVQRGIYFPKGKHQVKFIFQSNSFELGKKITISSWIIFSLTVFLYSFVFPNKVSGNKKPFPDRGSKSHSR